MRDLFEQTRDFNIFFQHLKEAVEHHLTNGQRFCRRCFCDFAVGERGVDHEKDGDSSYKFWDSTDQNDPTWGEFGICFEN